ncbi:MAG: cell division protein FtsB [Arsenophonus sp.]
MRKLTIILLTVFFWLQYSFWFGKNGVNDYLNIKNEVKILKILNMKYKSRNEDLFSEINDLNGKSEAIEELARTELGMIIPGESFYRIVNEHFFLNHKKIN